MDFGIHIGTRGCLTSRKALMAVAQRAEAFGYAYLGVPDHLIVPLQSAQRYPYAEGGVWPGAPTGECFDYIATLAFLAGCTRRVIGYLWFDLWFDPPVWHAQQGPDGWKLFSGTSSDMLADAAALETAGARHVILYLQRPTIEETLEAIQRFGEEVVRKA